MENLDPKTDGASLDIVGQNIEKLRELFPDVFTEEKIDSDPRGPWKAMDCTCRYTSYECPNLYYPITNSNIEKKVWPKKTRVWAMSKDVTDKNLSEDRIWWGVNGGNSVPALKNFLSDVLSKN